MRRLPVLALAAACALAAAGSAAPAGAVCKRAAARAAVLAARPLSPLWPTIRSSDGGVDRVICHDLTADGAVDMAATIFSGGTAGDTAWVLFRKVHRRWQLAYSVLEAYKVALERVGADVVETSPVYLKDDPNCCPTGGFDHRRYHWDGSRFAVVRSWHDRKPGA